MKFMIVAVGKLKERYWTDACSEYLKRIQPYVKTKVVEIADIDPARAGGETAATDREGAAILKALPERAHVVLLATQPVIGDDILPPEPDTASATNALPKAEAPVAPPATPASAPATNALTKAAAPAATNAIPDKASATKPDAK